MTGQESSSVALEGNRYHASWEPKQALARAEGVIATELAARDTVDNGVRMFVIIGVPILGAAVISFFVGCCIAHVRIKRQEYGSKDVEMGRR
ncbi:hypothetical protein N657DRAFT_642452 [Parathielavia appendiculata]|uniref:Uncharacterized protein n=1 Tax=Parathielavia appendiculata TaxID=2587402 RepID=A0AAN6Z679_9PEZI|nr:hypothetical protein N657DRAFT_642452 [Parathielavia appendiculata]